MNLYYIVVLFFKVIIFVYCFLYICFIVDIIKKDKYNLL